MKPWFALFWFLFSVSAGTQACVFWEWNNFLESQCPHGLEILRINMDESGIELFHGTDAGNLCVNKHVLPAPPELTQRVDSSVQKFALTRICMQ